MNNLLTQDRAHMPSNMANENELALAHLSFLSPFSQKRITRHAHSVVPGLSGVTISLQERAYELVLKANHFPMCCYQHSE